MSSNYAGDPSAFPPTVPILEDGDPPTAASIAPGLEALADRTAYLDANEAGGHAFNFPVTARLPGVFSSSPDVYGVTTLQSAASGGIPLLCALETATRKTHRVYHESGRSESDADGTTGVGPMHGAVAAGSPTLLRAIASTGVMRKSTDFGMTWSSADTTQSNVLAIHYFAAVSRWLAANDVTGVEWAATTLAAWNGASISSQPATQPRFASNDTAALIVYATASDVVARSTDASAWTLITLSAADHDWRGVAYNAELSTWLAVANDGVAARSTNDGLNWTEITVPDGAVDVIAFGRYFVALCADGQGITGLTTVAVSRDAGDNWSEYAIDHDTAASCFRRLLLLDGRIVACGVAATEARLIFSDRRPGMPVP